MALSYVTYTANGSTTQFDVTFSYIEQSHIKVYINNVEDTSFTWVNASRIQTSTTASNGQIVKIERTTPTASRLVDFADGSVLTESDLDKSANQNFFTVQENLDDIGDCLKKDNSGLYDAGSVRIINVADASATNDAVSKNYLENTWLTTANKADLVTVAGKATEIGRLGTADAVSDLNTLGTADIVNDMNVLGTSANVTAMNLLGTSDCVSDMNTLGTSAIVANMSTLAGISSAISNVSSISSAVSGVHSNASNINAVNADATDIGLVAGKATEIGRLGTSDAVADLALLGTSAVVADLALLATTDCIADMALLGTSDCVADMALLGVSDVISDMNDLATSANITAMGLLGNSTTVANMGLLGVSGVITNMGLLGTSAVIADLALLATSDVIADMAQLASSDFISDLNVLATSDIVTDMNLLATSANVTNMATLGASGVVANIATVAGANSNISTVAGSISNVNSVATNIASVNSFANTYRIASSAPSSSLDSGDLWFDTANDILKVYGGSGWQNAGSSINGTSARFKYIATSNQTTFTGNDSGGTSLSYDVGYIDVYLNGVHLDPTDYTASNGTSVVLGSGATTGDILYIVGFGTFSVANMNASNLSSGLVPSARINAGSIANDLIDSQHYASGSIDLEHMSSESVDEDNLHISNAGSNGQFLQKSSNAGGLTWATVDTSTLAPLASPTFTGNPVAPTQSAGNNSTRISTTAYVETAIANLVDSSPSALNTLNELASALGDDANFSTTVTNSIATKSPIASPTFTGSATTPTLGVISAKDLGVGLHIKTADSGASVSAYADELVIENSDNSGMTFLSGTSGEGNIRFGDSGDNSIGRLLYKHSDNSMQFIANGGEKFRIASSGQLGVGGANYGTDGQVLTSTGASSAPAWEDAGGGTNSPNFYAYVSASTTSFGANSLTKVPYNTEWWDIGGCFDTSNNRFVAPADGKYYFFASVRWENNLNGKEISLAPYLDGNAFGWVQKSTASYSTGWQTIWGHFTKDLSANQYIEIYARHNRGVSHNLGGGNTLNTTFGGFLLIE